MPQYTCGVKGNLRSQFFPSIMCVPEIKFRPLGSVGSAVTHGAVSLALRYSFINQYLGFPCSLFSSDSTGLQWRPLHWMHRGLIPGVGGEPATASPGHGLKGPVPVPWSLEGPWALPVSAGLKGGRLKRPE